MPFSQQAVVSHAQPNLPHVESHAAPHCRSQTMLTRSVHMQNDLNAAGEMRAMVQELMAQVAELQEAGTDLERQALKHRGAAEAAQMQIKVQCAQMHAAAHTDPDAYVPRGAT